jgi:hypothetical protein
MIQLDKLYALAFLIELRRRALKRGLLIAMMAILLALVATSCGGGGSDGSTVASTQASAQSGSGSAKKAAEAAGSGAKHSESEPTQSSAQGQGKRFVQQANAICSEEKKELLVKVGEYLEETASQSDRQQALLEVTRAILLPGMEAQIVAIRRLEPPAGSAAQVDAFLATWQRGLDTAAKSSQPMTGTYATKLLAPAGDHARKLGLSLCVYG